MSIVDFWDRMCYTVTRIRPCSTGRGDNRVSEKDSELKKGTPLLDAINDVRDLRAMRREEMPLLCEEIRRFLVESVEKTGGHLASNLGVVELSVALHRVFDTPHDHIIFDVGHQAYVHKLLTGRRDDFPTLRKPGGLSGFTRRSESEYDPFGAGHSSTSISAALGFAEADRLKGSDAYTVAVIGDGAFTGGMVHEALNNADSRLPLIIVLNENEMSISRNTGAFARYIAGMRTSRGYLATKRRTVRFLERLPLLGKPLYRFLQWLKDATKRRVVKNNYFEELGFLYLGPIDGNDYARVERELYRAKRRRGAVVLHIKTEKGHGYAPAMQDPRAYHHISGDGAAAVDGERFPEVLGKELTALAKEDPRICAITAATGFGCGLDPFAQAHPTRFFDVGIAEEHACTFAAGLAASGMLPCFAVYSSFLQRAYDNILHDVALQRLPVKLFIDRAGLSLADGATHHGIFDVSFLSGIPNMSIYAPATLGSLRAAVREALDSSWPVAVRYPNATEDARVAPTFYPDGDFENFGARADFAAGEEKKNIIVAFGTAITRAMDAALEARERGIDCGLVLVEFYKPYHYCADMIRRYLRGAGRVIFYEEGIRAGGAAVNLLDTLRDQNFRPVDDARVIAIRDDFVAPVAPCDLYDYARISTKYILAAMRK